MGSKDIILIAKTQKFFFIIINIIIGFSEKALVLHYSNVESFPEK